MTNTERLYAFLDKHYKVDSPRISLYMPTHRKSPDNKKDSILFKNLILEAEYALAGRYHRRDWEPVVAHLRRILGEADFWNRSMDGLAVLADREGYVFFRLEETLQKKLVVEKHFYILPLLRYYDPTGMAYLIDLSKDRIGFYRVGHNALVAVEQDEIKTSFPELFDDFDANSTLNFGGYAGGGIAYHGHRSKPEEQEKDREKYFRYLDRKLANFLGDKDATVILSGIPSNLSAFKKVAKSGFYTKTSIEKPLDSMSHNEKINAVRSILKPQYDKAIRALEERYKRQEAQGKLCVGLEQVATQAAAGRVEILLLSEDHGLASETALSALISQVMNTKGEVRVLDAGETDHKISAILRY